MRLRLSWVVFALLAPTLAFADDHWADGNAAGSGGGGGSTVYGTHLSLAIGIPKLMKPLMVVPADLSVQFGEQQTQVIYMAGARYTLAMSRDPERHPRMHANKVLLEALFGTVRTNEAAAQSTDNDFALGLGAGYEFLVKEKVTFRGMYHRIKRSGDRDESFNRFSAGVGYRWGNRQ